MNVADVAIVFLLMTILLHQNFGFITKITMLGKKEIFVSEFDEQTIARDIPEPNNQIKNKGLVCAPNSKLPHI